MSSRCAPTRNSRPLLPARSPSGARSNANSSSDNASSRRISSPTLLAGHCVFGFPSEATRPIQRGFLKLSLYSYRILFELKVDNLIEVLAVIHKRQQLEAEEIPSEISDRAPKTCTVHDLLLIVIRPISANSSIDTPRPRRHRASSLCSRSARTLPTWKPATRYPRTARQRLPSLWPWV